MLLSKDNLLCWTLLTLIRISVTLPKCWLPDHRMLGVQELLCLCDTTICHCTITLTKDLLSLKCVSVLPLEGMNQWYLSMADAHLSMPFLWSPTWAFWPPYDPKTVQLYCPAWIILYSWPSFLYLYNKYEGECFDALCLKQRNSIQCFITTSNISITRTIALISQNIIFLYFYHFSTALHWSYKSCHLYNVLKQAFGKSNIEIKKNIIHTTPVREMTIHLDEPYIHPNNIHIHRVLAIRDRWLW